jgi:hypothetical protein
MSSSNIQSVQKTTTPAAAGSQDLIIPDAGVLFEDGIHIGVSSAEITSVTLLFENGAAV